jgi:Na+-translocating ferredoxin:NAD+ oxidoreductase subunit B
VTSAHDQALVERIDALLPQTQCTQCGFAGCRPYAEAIAAGRADINQCPPGGQAGIVQLAALLGRAPLPLNPAHGIEQPLTVAVIDEALCIGCTLCIQACPVDAIVGAARRMHTVLAQHCTGCALCVAPCPTDCIDMRPVQPPRQWTRVDADTARARFVSRKARLMHEAAERDLQLEARAVAKLDELQARTDPDSGELDRKKAAVQAAIERARARRRQTAAPCTAPAPATVPDDRPPPAAPVTTTRA